MRSKPGALEVLEVTGIHGKKEVDIGASDRKLLLQLLSSDFYRHPNELFYLICNTLETYTQFILVANTRPFDECDPCHPVG